MKIEYIFIKPENEYCISEEGFQNFLCTNRRLAFNTENKNLLFDEHELQYALESVVVEKSKEVIFHLIVESISDENEQAEILESFDCLIREINTKCGELFSINTIWNDVSTHYASELYPQIVHIENKLRKIIYLFMLKTVGSGWFDNDSPKKVQQDVTNTIEKNGKKRNEINVDWLTYADFITLGYFFTAPYSLKSDINALFKELEQYGDVDNLNNDEKNTDNKEDKNNLQIVQTLTSDIIKKLSDEYEQKNNWDRYFSDKLSIKSPKKFSQDWSSLYDIRNKVAHGKPINKEVFDKANKLIASFNKAFEECIEIIDTLEITNEEAEAVEAIAQQVIPSDLADITRKTALSEDALILDTSAIPNWNTTINLPEGKFDILSSCTIPDISSSMVVKNTIIPEMIKPKNSSLALDKHILRDFQPKLKLSDSFLSQINSFANISEKVNAALDRPIYISSLTANKEFTSENDYVIRREKNSLENEISDAVSNEYDSDIK